MFVFVWRGPAAWILFGSAAVWAAIVGGGAALLGASGPTSSSVGLYLTLSGGTIVAVDLGLRLLARVSLFSRASSIYWVVPTWVIGLAAGSIGIHLLATGEVPAFFGYPGFQFAVGALLIFLAIVGVAMRTVRREWPSQ